MTRNHKTCGALGCTEDASAVVKIPNKGRRTLCETHSEGYEVVEHV